jgi:hypothetical protein
LISPLFREGYSITMYMGREGGIENNFEGVRIVNILIRKL